MTVEYPEKIYLQCEEDWDEFTEGQTWCKDRIFEHDVEYLRIDSVEINRLRNLEMHARRLKKQCERYDTQGCRWDCKAMRGLLHALQEQGGHGETTEQTSSGIS